MSAVDLGREYDALYRRSPFEDRPQLYDRVANAVCYGRSAPELRVLDIGCGIGGAVAALAAKGVRPIGIDLSREAVSRALERVPSARILVTDGSKLPFPDDHFDAVTHLGNLEHFDDLRGGVREMRRVLRPDGAAIVLLPNLFYSGAIWRTVRTGYGPDHHQPIDRFATRSEWRDLLEEGGLSVRRIDPYHKGKWWKRLLPSALAWHFLYTCGKSEPREARALDPLERRRPASNGQ